MGENKPVRWYPGTPACDHPEELMHQDTQRDENGQEASYADLDRHVYGIVAGESDWDPQGIIDNYINKGDTFKNPDYLARYAASLNALNIAIEYAMTPLAYLLYNGYDYHAPRISDIYNNLEKTSNEIKIVLGALEKIHGKFI